MTHLDPPPSFHPLMRKALVEGRKWHTTRGKKLGEVGDTFTIDGVTFRIKDVRQETFWTITYQHYRGEGFDTPGEFQAFWIGLHRGHLPAPGDLRWLHTLERLTK